MLMMMVMMTKINYSLSLEIAHQKNLKLNIFFFLL